MISVIIPTFNEKENIRPLTDAIQNTLKGLSYEVIFVDDSTDDTPLVIEEVCQGSPNVRYIHRTEKKGLATAVVEGFKVAGGDILAAMDGDLQHPPELLFEMYEQIRSGIDLVLPTRYKSTDITERGDSNRGLNSRRKAASGIATMSAKLMLKSVRKVSDPMSGFFMMKKEVIDGIEFKPIGWKILMEILVLGDYKKIVEIPYTFNERNAGKSKLNSGVSLQFFAHMLKLIWRSEADRRLFSFVLVGASGILIDMFFFWLFYTKVGFHINLCATLSALIAMTNNYILNRNITWRSHKVDHPGKMTLQYMGYILVCLVGIGIKNLIILLLNGTGLHFLLLNFIGILAGGIWNYNAYNLLVFHRKKVEK